AFRTDSIPHHMAATRRGLFLAWTDVPPDTACVRPLVRTLRLARSLDRGMTWMPLPPVARRAGAVPGWPAIAADGQRVDVLFTTRDAAQSGLALGRSAPDAGGAPLAMPGLATPRGTYTLEPQLAARAADLWAAHTLARPAASRRLFIEGYYMRGLV